MIYNYDNKKDFDKLYINDSLFEGFQYNYQKREISITCKNYNQKKIFNLIFLNVIYCKLQSCCFWCNNGFSIYDIELKDKNNELKQLIKIKDSKPDWFEYSYLNKNINFVTFEIKINSGDTLLIICESVDFSETELNE